MKRWSCVVWLMLVACGDDGITINTSLSNLCDQVAEVACHNMYQCCTEGEIENYLRVTDPRTEEQCRTDVQKACSRSSVVADARDSLAAGRITFDSAAMNECLSSILAPSGTCSTVVTELPWVMACMSSAFVGTVATGDTCFFNEDCTGAPDSYCTPTQKCAAKPTSGMPCGAGCASGYFCNLGACVARQSEGATCSSTQQCAMDLYCDFSTTPARCAKTKGGGETCNAADACGTTNQCVPGMCAGTTYSCYRDRDCPGTCANNGMYCNTPANCAPGTCMVSRATCYDDSYCNPAGGDYCNFPIACLASCSPAPVCSVQELTIDYCHAVTQIPVPI